MAFTATPGSFTPINMWAMLRMLINNLTPILNNPGPPVNGVTFAGQAGPGALLIDFVGPNPASPQPQLYINEGTLASPVWSKVFSGLPGGVVQYLPAVNTGLFAELFNEGVTAVGGSQNSAFPITGAIARITSGGVGAGVRLPPAVGGLDIFLINHSGFPVQVYGDPGAGDTINDIPGSIGITQMQDSVLAFFSTKVGAWYTADQATGFSRLTGLLTQSFLPTVTAAGTTQPTATVLNTMFNRVTTVPTGSGVALPPATPGEFVTVNNRGANPLRVYGNNFNALTSLPDTINGAPAGTAIVQPVNSIQTYYCSVLGNWETAFSGAQPDSITPLNVNGAIDPHTPHTYNINKTSGYSGTLAAPTAGVDDGIRLKFTSTTNFAHTITTLGLLNTGLSFVNSITFNAFAGASVDLMAIGGRWQVMDQNQVTFS